MNYLRHISILLVLALLCLACANQPEQKNKSSYISNTELTAALGKWQRTDGDYILELKNLKTDSTLEVAYLNPKPINVGESSWKVQNGYLYLYVKLDDEGYPGSYYSLGYYKEDDHLYGFYYQAMQQQKFEVAFERK
jgi:hypothetical protein